MLSRAQDMEQDMETKLLILLFVKKTIGVPLSELLPMLNVQLYVKRVLW